MDKRIRYRCIRKCEHFKDPVTRRMTRYFPGDIYMAEPGEEVPRHFVKESLPPSPEVQVEAEGRREEANDETLAR